MMSKIGSQHKHSMRSSPKLQVTSVCKLKRLKRLETMQLNRR